ncbi:MAG: hypothetical protein WC942_08475 [Clostridia bacterium]
MKYLDEVRLITNRKTYEEYGVHKDMIGTIMHAEIRFNEFYVIFTAKNGCDIADIDVKIEDLELVKPSNVTDEDILDDLPLHNPSWWCKVENGYILNLKGEKKNKTPFDYNS